jgi:Tat protein translocase TatB subunit
MFDIGFSEVLLIFLLALIVLGPEKLPKVASQVGRWIGRARGMARQFREQLEEEVNLEEARKAQPPISRTPPPIPPTPPPTEVVPGEAHGVGSNSASTAHTATGSSEPGVSQAGPVGSYTPPPPEPAQPVYPDHYSHAHPTDSLGRPIPAPSPDPPAPESGQQDWVGGVTEVEKTAQAEHNGAYASSHERGT